MTLSQYTVESRKVRDRAERIRLMRAERARIVWDGAFGGRSQNFAFFLYAHNWGTLATLTPVQRHACRFVQYMDRRQWEPSRIAEQVAARWWLACCREHMGYKG